MRLIKALFAFLALILTPSLLLAAAPAITKLSLEELLDTEVTSVSKSARPLSQSAAAVYVMDQETIRRSSAQSIPELLRMVPGVDVAQTSKNTWAISIRGFNDVLANKLLVLIDGRSVYTPLFGGVYWDSQDLVLEDIDRIEVIRGPGGSLWGSNAVNGVINIITKKSQDTQGVLVEGGGGSERAEGAGRYGGKIGEDAAYRVYAKYFNEDSSYHGNDAWQQGRAGFRSDWDVNEDNTLTFQGDYYNGEEDVTSNLNFAEAPYQRTILEDQTVAGGNILGRWHHVFSDTSDGNLQTYFDQTRRDQTQIEEDRYTWDIEWDHRFNVGERNEVVYGAGYRLSYDDTEGSFNTSFIPDDDTFHLSQAFVQDTLAIFPEKLWLTGGLKVEHNSYTAFEFQPTARLLWQITPKQSLWTAYSRAIHTPSRVERDIQLQAWVSPPAILVPITSDTTTESETLNAYEMGYRAQLHPRFFVDTAVFYNHYNGLRNSRFGTSYTENGILKIPVFFDDQSKANTYGTEVAATTKILDWWELYSSYSLFRMQLETHQDPIGAISQSEGRSPKHQVFLQSRVNLPANLEWDTEWRYVDSLKALRVGAYWEMNMRLGWHLTENIQVALIGQNLFHNHHQEFTAAGPGVQRAVYGKTTVEF